MRKLIITIIAIMMLTVTAFAEDTGDPSQSEAGSTEAIESTETATDTSTSEEIGETTDERETTEETVNIAESNEETPQIPQMGTFSSSVIYNEDHTIATVIAEYLGECTELTLANEEEITPFVEAGLYQVNMEQGDWSNKIAFDVLSNGMICLEINVWNNDTLIGTKLVKSSVIGLNNDAKIFEPEQTTYEIVSSDVGTSDSRSMSLTYETNVSFTWSIPTELTMSSIEDSMTVTVNSSNLATETALRIRLSSGNNFELHNADPAVDDALSYMIKDTSGTLLHNDDVILDHLYNQDSTSNTLNIKLTKMPVYSGGYSDTLTFTASVERILSSLYSGKRVVVNNLGTTHNITNLKIYGIGNQVQSKGLNLWDEQWELGDISNSGELTISNSMFRSKNPINIKPDTTYYFHSDIEGVIDVFLYDDSMNLVQLIRSASVKNKSFVTPSNAKYLKFYNTGQTYYDGGIAIIEGTNGKYEPYTGGVPTPSPDNPSEIQNVLNPSVMVTGKNLLNSTLQTQTVNGVTCTNNGDGTYTVNGTASTDTKFPIGQVNNLNNDLRYMLVGCPKNGNKETTYSLWSNATGSKIDIGNGIDCPSVSFSNNVCIVIKGGATVSNLVFKPMVTTDLNATYDDYEPYPGEQTATLPYTLNAIPVSEGGNIEVDGQQYISDYVDIENKKLVRMVGDVDLGSLSWKYLSDYNTFWTIISDNKERYGNCIATAFALSKTYYPSASNNTCGFILETNDMFGVKTDKYTDVDTFKQAMQGVKLLYELETPTTVDLTGEEVQAFKELYTYQPTTVVSCSSNQLTPYIEFGLS